MKHKLILLLSMLTSAAFATTPESATLPISATLNLNSTMDLTSSRILNTVMNPVSGEPELPIFILSGALPKFSGQVAGSKDGKLLLESVVSTYFPFTNGAVPGVCSFNQNASVTCFHPNSLVIEDNNIIYQLRDGNTLINNKLDTGIMGASIKFFAATEFKGTTPTRYIGISNDTFKKQLYWLDCAADSACKLNKIKVKPEATAISPSFQLINNQLYFIVNYNILVQLNLSTGDYTAKPLNVYNVTAFAVAKDGSIYVLNSIRSTTTPSSFAISQCSIKNGECNSVYRETTYPSRYSRLFMGVDDKSFYLIANKTNDSIRGATSLILLSVPRPGTN